MAPPSCWSLPPSPQAWPWQCIPLTPGVPLDPGIPNEQAVIAAGLSGAPGPGQPTRPFAVDRVLVDGAATYVQYHRSGPALAPGVGGVSMGTPRGG